MSIFKNQNLDAATLKRKRNDFIYQSDVNHHLECCICHDPLQDAVQHTDKKNICKVAFCRLCLQDYKNKTKTDEEGRLYCPNCREPINCDNDFVEVARCIKNLTDEISVKCNSCSVMLKRGDLSTHWEKYCTSPCIYKCGKMLTGRIENENHIVNECLNAPCKCPSAPSCSWFGCRSELTCHIAGCKIAQITLLQSKLQEMFNDHLATTCMNNLKNGLNGLNNNLISLSSMNSGSASTIEELKEISSTTTTPNLFHPRDCLGIFKQSVTIGQTVDVFLSNSRANGWKKGVILSEDTEDENYYEIECLLSGNSTYQGKFDIRSDLIAPRGMFTDSQYGRRTWTVGTPIYVYFSNLWYPGEIVEIASMDDFCYYKRASFWTVRVFGSTYRFNLQSPLLKSFVPHSKGVSNIIKSSIEDRKLGFTVGKHVDVYFSDRFSWEKGIIDEIDEYPTKLNMNTGFAKAIRVRSLVDVFKFEWFDFWSTQIAASNTHSTVPQIELDVLNPIKEILYEVTPGEWIKSEIVQTGPNCICIKFIEHPPVVKSSELEKSEIEKSETSETSTAAETKNNSELTNSKEPTSNTSDTSSTNSSSVDQNMQIVEDRKVDEDSKLKENKSIEINQESSIEKPLIKDTDCINDLNMINSEADSSNSKIIWISITDKRIRRIA